MTELPTKLPVLLPCPFCGSKAEIMRGYTGIQITIGCGSVRCPVNPATTPYDLKGSLRTKDAAIAAWNNRK
jgi:Lar family restriction alleviation protein